MDERELGSTGISRVEPYLPTEMVEYLAAYLKPEACSLFELVKFNKSPEHFFRVLFLYAASLVCYSKFCYIDICVNVKAKCYVSLVAEFDGIGKKVNHHLAKTCLVGHKLNVVHI